MIAPVPSTPRPAIDSMDYKGILYIMGVGARATPVRRRLADSPIWGRRERGEKP